MAASASRCRRAVVEEWKCVRDGGKESGGGGRKWLWGGELEGGGGWCCLLDYVDR